MSPLSSQPANPIDAVTVVTILKSERKGESIYNSWLGPLSLLPEVFLGSRSEEIKVSACWRWWRWWGMLTLVNVGEDTTLGDGDVTEQLVQLLVVTDGELQVTRDDTRLLVVTSGVTSQLEDLSSQVLKDGSEVDRGT